MYQAKGRQEIRQRSNNGENNPHRLTCWKEHKNSGRKSTVLWAIAQRKEGNKSESNPKLQVAQG